MSTYQLEAVLLKRQDFKEYDQLLTVYTEKIGKLEVVARGVKKIQSKLSGHLQQFCIIDLVIARGKYHDRVTGSRMSENFNHLKSDIEGIALAGYFNEAVDLLTRIHQSDPNTYRLVKKTYQYIDRSSFKKSSLRNQFLIVLSFLLHLLSLQGFQPHFRQCFYCKRKIKEEKNYISYSRLSIVCPSCQKRKKNLELISPTALKILRIMTNDDFFLLKLINLSDSIFWEIQEIVNNFLIEVSEKEIKSISLLKDLLQLSNK